MSSRALSYNEFMDWFEYDSSLKDCLPKVPVLFKINKKTFVDYVIWVVSLEEMKTYYSR